MVLTASQRPWDSENRARQACAAASVPPPFLVYKRRLYVLARRPPVLDHHQAQLDSVFGSADEPAGNRRIPARTAVHPAAAQNLRHGGPSRVRDATRQGRERRPRFVPRDI